MIPPLSTAGSAQIPPLSVVALAEIKRVLVVDNDPDVLDVTIELLEYIGYQTAGAGNGNTALQAIHAGRFDAVVSDCLMPGMNGFEMLDRIRAEYRDLPVILASGHFDAVMVAQRAQPQIPVLQKPYDMKELKAALAAAEMWIIRCRACPHFNGLDVKRQLDLCKTCPYLQGPPNAAERWRNFVVGSSILNEPAE